MGLGFFIFLVIVLPIIIIFSVKKLRNCFFDWILVDVLKQGIEEDEEITDADIDALIQDPTPTDAPSVSSTPTEMEDVVEDVVDDTEQPISDSTSGYRIRRSHEPVPFVW
jgi:hypothetical protein